MRGSPRARPDRGLIIVSIYTTEIKSEIASILFAINRVMPVQCRAVPGGFLAVKERSSCVGWDSLGAARGRKRQGIHPSQGYRRC